MDSAKSHLNAFINLCIDIMIVIDALFFASAQVIAELWVNAWANSFPNIEDADAIGVGVFVTLMAIGAGVLLFTLLFSIADFFKTNKIGPTFGQVPIKSGFQLLRRLIWVAVRNGLLFWLQLHIVGQMVVRYRGY